MAGHATAKLGTAPEISAVVAPERPHHFVFVLLDQFTLLCLASALDALRLANRMSGTNLYTWSLVGEGGKTATCSAGTKFVLDGDLVPLERNDTVLVVGGVNVGRATTTRLQSWLRREARRGDMIAGLCTAAWSLAASGLLDGKRAKIGRAHV